MIQFIDSFIYAVAAVLVVFMLCAAITELVGLAKAKIDANNRFYKRELKDRNNIIAELLNSRNR